MYIKPSNYQRISNFVHGVGHETLRALQLQALYRLQEKKGTDVKTEDPLLKGCKCLEIGKNEYLVLIRKGSTTSFYPCSIHCLLLTPTL